MPVNMYGESVRFVLDLGMQTKLLGKDCYQCLLERGIRVQLH